MVFGILTAYHIARKGFGIHIVKSGFCYTHIAMGIHGLTKLLADHAPASMKENEIKNYFGKKNQNSIS